uniref:Uncharacterized protein n=1 Tax=Anguilla anguilla TaxID=7936 RepID=A0A0E9W1K2_ANGAN
MASVRLLARNFMAKLWFLLGLVQIL